MARQALHHGVVNRVAGASRKGVFADPHELAVGRALPPCCLAGLQDVGPAQRQCREPDRRAHHENAAVPQVRALVQVSLCRLQIGFFDKAGNVACRAARLATRVIGRVSGGLSCNVTVFSAIVGTRLNVAIARLGRVGRDAKGHHRALRRQACAGAHRRLESCNVDDDMIGRHHQQNRVVIVFNSKQCSKSEGWSRISPYRFEHNGAGLAHQPELLGDDKTVLFIADHQRRGHLHAGNALHAAHRGLQQRIVANQGQQLFWVFFARQRPQAGAGAARQDNGLNEHLVRPGEVGSFRVRRARRPSAIGRYRRPGKASRRGGPHSIGGRRSSR